MKRKVFEMYFLSFYYFVYTKCRLLCFVRFILFLPFSIIFYPHHQHHCQFFASPLYITQLILILFSVIALEAVFLLLYKICSILQQVGSKRFFPTVFSLIFDISISLMCAFVYNFYTTRDQLLQF